LDEDRNKWIGAIRKDKLSWTHVSDLKGNENQAAILYGGEDLERKLQEIFKAEK
jgi:hypothetical protein